MTARPKKRVHTPTTILTGPFYARLDRLLDGMTYAQIGSMTKTPPETCRRYLRGLSKPSLEWAVRVSRRTGVSIDWLVTGSDASRRPPRRPGASARKRGR